MIFSLTLVFIWYIKMLLQRLYTKNICNIRCAPYRKCRNFVAFASIRAASSGRCRKFRYWHLSSMSKVSHVWTILHWESKPSLKEAVAAHLLPVVAMWQRGSNVARSDFFRDARNPKFVCEISRFFLWASGSVVKYNSLRAKQKHAMCMGCFCSQGWLFGSSVLRPQNRSGTEVCALWQEIPALGNGKLFFVQFHSCSTLLKTNFQCICSFANVILEKPGVRRWRWYQWLGSW